MPRIFRLLVVVFLSTVAFAQVAAAGSLTSVSLAPSNPQAGQPAVYTASFTTSASGNGVTVGLPKDGRIIITFPAGFDLSGVDNASAISGLTGDFSSANASGNVVTLIRDGSGNDVAGNTPVTIDFDIVTNATTAGVYQGSVETRTAANVVIDSGTSSNFSITAAALDHFAFNSISSPQTAGDAFGITITAKDVFNNTVTSFSGTATLSDNTGTISPTTTTAFNSGIWSGNVTITKGQLNVVITATSSGKQGQSNTFNVNGGALDHFIFAPIINQTAGAPFSITITAQDAFDNTATGFIGTATLSDNTGTISPTATSSFNAGVWTGNVTIATSGDDNQITAASAGKQGQSNTFSVGAGALDHFAFDPISNQTAGVPFSLAITAQDAFDNTVTGFTGTVTLSDNTGTISPATTANFEDGVWSDNVTIAASVSNNQITATGSGKQGQSNAFDVNAGALDHFAFSLIATQTAGAPFGITITAQDAFNNTVTSFAGIATLSDNTGTISPTSTTAFNSGAWSGNVTITKSQANVVITAVGSGKQGQSNSFQVNAAALDHFSFANVSSPQIAGQKFAVTITAQDVFNNTVTSYTSTVNLSDNTATLSPTVSGPFVAGVRADSLAITKSQSSVQITATGGGKQGLSNIFAVNAGALDHFTFATIPNQTAGSPFSITITAKDVYENTVTSYGSTVNLTDNTGTISPTTSPLFIAGVRSFEVAITKSQSSVAITASGVGKQGTSNVFDVIAVLDRFVFNTISSTQTAGAPFSVTITAKDGFNNTVTSFSGTVSLSDSTGTLSPTTVNLNSGAGSGNFTITKSRSSVRITASANGKTGLSNAFNVNPASLNHFGFAIISAPQTAGVAFAVSIFAQDFYNNTVTSFVDSVALSDATGSLSRAFSGAFINGVWSDSVTITKSQTGVTITASRNSFVGTSNAFDVNSGPLDRFVFGAIPSPQTAGVPFLLSLTALDLYNNIVTTFVDSVTLSEPTNTIAPQRIGGFSNGSFLDNVTVTKADTALVITASALGRTGASSAFNVVHAPLDHFSIAAIDTQTAGAPFPISITAQDVYQNTVASFAETAALQDESGTLTPSASGVFSNGVSIDSVAITKSQQTSIMVNGHGKSGQSSAFFVKPAALHHFSIDPIVDQMAGVPFDITIHARDVYENVATAFASEVSLSDMTGSLLPRAIDGFQSGQWTGTILVIQPAPSNQISVVRNGGAESGVSNPFVLAPQLNILSIDASPSKVNRGQQDNIVNMVIENTSSKNITLTSSGLTFTGPGEDNRTAQYVVTRTDTISIIPPGLQRTLSFSVDVSLSADLELITIDGNVAGMFNNQTVVDNDADVTDQWQVQSPAALSVSSVTALTDTVSLGQTGLNVTMRVHNNGTADANVTSLGLKFRVGANDVTALYTFYALPNSGVIAGSVDTDFEFAVDVNISAPVGMTILDGVVLATDANSGAAIADSGAVTTDQWLVQEAPVIGILSIIPSQPSVTRQQARAWNVTMSLQNNGGSEVRLDSARINLFIGSEVTGQYGIVNPTVFLNSGTPILDADGAQDQLRFNITSTGTTTGTATMQGHVFLTDLATNSPIQRSSVLGLGSVRVETQAQVAIENLRVSQPTVNRRQTQNWQVTVDVTNSGDSDVRIDTVGVATRILFSLASDFVVLLPTISGSSGFVLEGDSTKSLTFTVDTSSDVLGVNAISSDVAWEELNSGRRVTTSSGGVSASVTVQTPAQIRMLQTRNASPTAPDVFKGADFPVEVKVENLGQESVRNVLVDLVSNGISTFTAPLSIATIGGNQTATLNFMVHADAQAFFQEIFEASILQGIGNNVNAPAAIGAAVDSLAIANIEPRLLNSNSNISQPVGAQDSVVSTDQTFTLTTTVVYDSSQIHEVLATLALPPGYTTSDQLTKIPDAVNRVHWNITAPPTPDPNTSWMVIQAQGKDITEATILARQDSVSIRTMVKARLRVVAVVANPPNARSVVTGQQFDLQAVMDNDGDAGVTGSGTVRLQFSLEGYTTNDNLVQPFTLGAPAQWRVQAPSQATLATPIFCIMETVPSDENSGLLAEVVADTAVVFVSTISDTSLAFSNYPNPFGSPARNTTTLYYYLRNNADVQISIYSLLGELVWMRSFKATDAEGQPGAHQTLTWDAMNGEGLPVLNGVYVAQLSTSDGQQATRKIAVVK
jgi:hypothetical protein